MSTKDIALGRYSSMPEVGGASIVESGSNSDGEWFKSADGFLQCFLMTTLGGSGTGYWTYPSAFSAPPVVTGTVDCRFSDAGNIFVAEIYDTQAQSTGLRKSYQVRMEVDATWGLASSETAHLKATGHWK